MPVRTAKSGSELFIVDNSDTEWKVAKYLPSRLVSNLQRHRHRHGLF